MSLKALLSTSDLTPTLIIDDKKYFTQFNKWYIHSSGLWFLLDDVDICQQLDLNLKQKIRFEKIKEILN